MPLIQYITLACSWLFKSPYKICNVQISVTFLNLEIPRLEPVPLSPRVSKTDFGPSVAFVIEFEYEEVASWKVVGFSLGAGKRFFTQNLY